jgi:uncharacterized membrane protein
MDNAPSGQTSNKIDFNTPTVIYILYLLGFVLGITPLIGVVMAYVNRGEAEPWMQTHYTFQIRTFWIGILYTVIGLVLTLILVGFLVLLFVTIWYIVRCIQGLMAANRGEAMANPTTWWFG